LTYTYGTSGSNDDLLARITEIKENTTSLVQYTYNGIATPMKTTYPQPGLILDYTVSTALDRFNRIIDHAWKKSGADIVRIQHGYDRMSNRNYRKDMVSTTNSELYSYDGINQVKSLNRGALNPSNNGITGSTFAESWNFDLTGNWLQYVRAGVTENRTHNKANEIQSTVTHDRNGNMTVMPGLQGKYDAWNRLVEVRNASNVVLATYGYNGLNQRVRKTASNVVTTSFYNSSWQELESITSNQTTVNIWGGRYIDDLVLRDRGAERLYLLADPNWNVIATTNASGTVQERMRYDAFGKVTWMNASFSTIANSAYAWNRTFTGQVLDSESGLMLYRMRYYNTGLGRFISRDPIGYDAEDANLYRYVGNRSLIAKDPDGYDVWVENTKDVHGLHQRVCVTTYDDDCEPTGKYCISFYIDGEGGDAASCGCGGNGNTKGKGATKGKLPGGIRIDPNGAGVVGPDYESDPTRESKRSSSCCKEDKETLDYFLSLEGTRGHYDPYWNSNCRTFSQGCIKEIKKRKK